jgi:hypothetical protein
MRFPLQLGLGSYESISMPFSSQRCVNLYASVAQAEALSSYALFYTPGISAFATTDIFKSRGSIVMGGVYYVVTGNILYSIDSFGVKTSLGTITGDKRVVMAHNGTKLAIVAPDIATLNMWQWDADTTTLTQVSDVDYRASSTVCFKDGYYIFTEQNSNVFFVSNLNQPLVFDALDFGTAELAPGDVVGCHVSQDELYIQKRENSEVFQNVGGSGFPFQRVPGAAYEKGSHSKYSPIEWQGMFYFLGGGVNEKTSVYRAGTTGEPIKVSTDAIDNEIQKFEDTEIAEGFSFTFSIAGVSLVGFTIRSVNIPDRTFVYNVTASALEGRPVWSELQTGVAEDGWRANSVDTVYNKLLVSDSIDGRIGSLELDTQTEYGAIILREKSLPPLSVDGNQILTSSLELTMDSGKGLLTGQGSDPMVMMMFSDDGANTWSPELWRSAGKIGQYKRRVEWRRLGRSPSHRVYKFSMSDPIKTVFIKAEVEGQVVN